VNINARGGVGVSAGEGKPLALAPGHVAPNMARILGTKALEDALRIRQFRPIFDENFTQLEHFASEIVG